MSRTVIPESIRWRLPLSYSAIALLTALALGILLLASLRSYYAQQELDYLKGNAAEISAQLSPLIRDRLPIAALESQLAGYAFLSQTRVRILDSDLRTVADSGEFPPEGSLATIRVEAESDQSSTASGEQLNYRTHITIVSSDGALSREIDLTVVGTCEEPCELPELFGTEGFAPDLGLLGQSSVVGTPYGFGFQGQAAPTGPRSTQVVRSPLHSLQGAVVGYIELSEGPAYGRSVLLSVATGWTLASLAAVSLAASAGWIISRRLATPLIELTDTTSRMTGGDWTARASVDRADELGTLSRSINQMADKVEDTIATLRRFIADGAHELHTPLTALKTDLELISDDMSTSGVHTQLDRALAHVDRLETLTTGLLNLSRIESGLAVAEIAPVNLGELIREVSELSASQAEQAGLDFQLEIPTGEISVRGNAAQLKQAVRNLLDNALKFTPEGGQVAVALRVDDGWAVLQVEDTGIGIPEHDLPYLFRRFHRGSNAGSIPGSGLGLAIVRAIAENHGGQVELDSRPGGSRFRLRLRADYELSR